jgi:hypothetical protein
MSAFLISFFALAAVLWAGCSHRQNNASGNVAAHLHVAAPPHGGTPVPLGDDYQIEWVLDAAAGKLQAYVLDGEMETFVRIAAPSFDVTARLPDGEKVLHFVAVPNPATGEKAGSTCLFEAQADWLKTAKTFAAVIPEINVQGTIYTNVAFNFAQGNAPDGKEEK